MREGERERKRENERVRDKKLTHFFHYAYDRVSKIDNISLKYPQGGIYLFFNIEKTELDCEEFSKILLENGVLVLPGNIFGDDYKYYIRLTCNKDIKILEEAFERIEEICNKQYI